MPDAGSSRKRQIPGYLFAAIYGNSGLLIEAPNGIPGAGATYVIRVSQMRRGRGSVGLRNFFHRDLRCGFRNAAVAIREMMSGNSKVSAASSNRCQRLRRRCLLVPAAN
jgi:hypothetical protein